MFAHQPLESGDDARRNPIDVRVRRRDFHQADERSGGGIDGYDIGKRTTDIDSDANVPTALGCIHGSIMASGP